VLLEVIHQSAQLLSQKRGYLLATFPQLAHFDSAVSSGIADVYNLAK
jgi:hypothetical protein